MLCSLFCAALKMKLYRRTLNAYMCTKSLLILSGPIRNLLYASSTLIVMWLVPECLPQPLVACKFSVFDLRPNASRPTTRRTAVALCCVIYAAMFSSLRNIHARDGAVAALIASLGAAGLRRSSALPPSRYLSASSPQRHRQQQHASRGAFPGRINRTRWREDDARLSRRCRRRLMANPSGAALHRSG